VISVMCCTFVTFIRDNGILRMAVICDLWDGGKCVGIQGVLYRNSYILTLKAHITVLCVHLVGL
jgi:hypothetical protein